LTWEVTACIHYSSTKAGLLSAGMTKCAAAASATTAFYATNHMLLTPNFPSSITPHLEHWAVECQHAQIVLLLVALLLLLPLLLLCSSPVLSTHLYLSTTRCHQSRPTSNTGLLSASMTASAGVPSTAKAAAAPGTSEG
jgi:hypothetical protein